jgi:hypothetical protein
MLLGVMVVLPAERGIDPTGVGRLLGLTRIGELKNPTGDSNPGASADEGSWASRTDTVEVTLGPKKSTEVKALMRAGDQLVYSWRSDGGDVFFDFHGEEKGAASGVFTSFEKGTRGTAEGTFTAPFEGVHGWYWKNTSSEPTTVRLETTGVYRDLHQLQ